MFGAADVLELIGLLETDPSMPRPGSRVPRPSRVRSVLASRACRSSIMIGKHLTLGTMRRVVSNLSNLQSPWNCPHGRPTMRHLCVLPDDA